MPDDTTTADDGPMVTRAQIRALYAAGRYAEITAIANAGRIDMTSE